MVELDQGETRGEGGLTPCMKGLQSLTGEFALHQGSPVVEVTGHQQRGVRGNLARDEALQLRELAFAAGAYEPEVNDDHMDRASVDQQFRVQQATLFKAVVRHVLMLVGDHGPARQHCVTVLAMACHGVGPVDRHIAFGRQEISLRHVRPAREATGAAAMDLAHLLQADNVSVELLDRVSQVVDFESPLRPHALHPLMDVVGDDADQRQG